MKNNDIDELHKIEKIWYQFFNQLKNNFSKYENEIQNFLIIY